MNLKKYILSVITVCYNAENQIEITLNSLINQVEIKELYGSVEYIVIDGLSTDSTLLILSDRIKAMEKTGYEVTLVSEKDSGIYDAMNKGIKTANGEWILLLNAGDFFTYSNGLKKLYNYLVCTKADILYSDYMRRNKYILKKIRIKQIWNLKKEMIFCHQAVFVRKNVYSKILYDITYQIVADYDFFLKAYLQGFRFEHIKTALITYDTDGISSAKMLKTYREIYQVRKNNNVIENTIIESILYFIGIAKRSILMILPQKFRWKLYRILKGD